MYSNRFCIRSFHFLFFLTISFFLYATIETITIQQSSMTEVIVSGSLTEIGAPGEPVEVGICYGGTLPNITDNCITVTPQTGIFSCTISDMEPDGDYNFRAYVKYSDTTVYGRILSIHSIGPLGSGYLSESFEGDTFPPPGWTRVCLGGSNWVQSWSGRTPFPAWMSGTMWTPEGGGNRMAYCTYSYAKDKFPDSNAGDGKINNNWIISRKVRNVQPDTVLGFWVSKCFIKFADILNVKISTTGQAVEDFTIDAATYNFPRETEENTTTWEQDRKEYEYKTIPIGTLVPAGSDIYIGFQEYYFNNWYDVGGMQLDLINSGDQKDYAMELDGIDDAITLPVTHSTSEYTIEAWVCPTDTSSVNIISRNSGDPTVDKSHQLWIDENGRFNHSCYADTLQTVTGTTIAQAGHWYHIVGTAVDNKYIHLYINGKLEGSVIATNILWRNGTQYSVGASTTSGVDEFYEGQISDLRIWHKELTVEEIIEKMHFRLRGAETNLTAYYPLQSASETVEDAGLQGLDGTFLNGPSILEESLCPKGNADFASWNHLFSSWSTQTDPEEKAIHGLTISQPAPSSNDFILFADNAGSGTSREHLEATTGMRLTREWKIDVTGSGVSTLSFNLTEASGDDLGLITVDKYILLKRTATDSDFVSFVTGATSRTDSVITFENVSLESGLYTLAIDDALPLVTTSDFSSITALTASGGGSISHNGGSSILSRGVCWKENAEPSISDVFTTDGTGTGDFTSSLTGLTQNTIYKVRAYATNVAGTGYGDVITITSNDIPIAVADSYSFYPGVERTVTTSVLNNDTDSESLTAVLDTPPANGVLNLESDGTFTYTPENNSYTTTFTYRASDGIDQSETATVTLSVATATWNGNGNWDDDSKWTIPVIPGNTDHIIVQSGSLIVPDNTQLGNMSIENGTVLMGNNVTMGNLTMNGGYATLTGNLQVQNLTLETGTALTVPLNPFALTIQGEYHDNGGTMRAAHGGVITIQGSVYQNDTMVISNTSPMKVYSGLEVK